MIVFPCTNCGAELSASEELVGHITTCTCGAVTEAPASAARPRPARDEAIVQRIKSWRPSPLAREATHYPRSRGFLGFTFVLAVISNVVAGTGFLLGGQVAFALASVPSLFVIFIFGQGVYLLLDIADAVRFQNEITASALPGNGR